MKKSRSKHGYIRYIDDLGRVSIPKEISRAFNWREGTGLKFTVERRMFGTEEVVVIRAHQINCIFCGREDCGELKGVPVCRTCVEEIANENLAPDY